MSHDIEQAKHFLTLLDEGEEQFTFQTFDDKPGKNPVLAKWLHGTIDEHFETLVNYNKAGAGVFVMAQHGDGSGRNIKAVDRIRCVFNENDNGVTKEYPLEPHIIVETSPGKQHHYFLCDGIKVDDFKSIQGRLIADYGSDPAANDLPRVLRLPGFFHNKREPHMVRIVHESGGQVYSRDRIIQAYPPYIREVERKKEDIKVDEKLVLELRSALNGYRPDEYKTWIDTGLALKSLGDVGLGLWFDWSSGYAAFDRQEAYKKWDGFVADSIGYKSVFFMSQEAGWVNVAKKSDVTTIEDDGEAWVTASELARDATAPEYLIDNILESRTHGLLAGGSQAFKSFCVLKIAHSICTGHDFFNHAVYRTGKVLYICGEGMGALGRRIKAINIVEGDIGDNLIIKRKPLAIDNIADMDWLRQQINALEPVLVVFDTFSSLATSTGENTNEEVARALRMVMDSCSEHGASSIIVHHYGKDTEKGSRGASAFSANVDFELSMKRDPNAPLSATLSCKKSKDGEYFDDILIKAHVVDLGLTKQNGMKATSLVLKSADYLLGTRQQKAFDIIKRLILDEGIEDGRILGVNETQLRKALLDGFRDSLSNPSKVFYETIPELKEKGVINEKDGFFWIS